MKALMGKPKKTAHRYVTLYLFDETYEMLSAVAKRLRRQGVKGLYQRSGIVNQSAVVRYLLEQAAKND